MFAKPTAEHQRLDHLIGDWDFETECNMGPDQPAMKSTGTSTVRSLGGLWFLIEGQGEGPNGEMALSVITLGYDLTKQKYVGTFIGSMMDLLWLYEGQYSDADSRIVMDTEGPKFDGSGTACYQDIFTFLNQDHWTLSSRVQNADGSWTDFMMGHYRRRK